MLKPMLISLLLAGISLASAIDASVGVDVNIDVGVGLPPRPGKQGPDVAAAWFASWHGEEFPPSKVSWNKYTHMTYAFAESSPNVTAFDISNPELLPVFVKEAHKHGVKALISAGGWTGSRFFSTAVATPQNRTAFVKTVVDTIVKYKLDGIDFDWEYPNHLGIGCNTVSPNDTANFLSFLQELRRHPVGRRSIITAAAATSPFLNAEGRPSEDVSGFAKVFDWLCIMNYDTFGSWSDTSGPNAPLDESCAPPEVRVQSATSAVANWHKAGFPHNKLCLGVPAYGHSFRVRKTEAFINGTQQLNIYGATDRTDPPTGDRWDDGAGSVDACGTTNGPGGSINYWGMIELGYLNEDGTPKEGRPYVFDNCTQTPFSYNPEEEIMVSYDNARSSLEKGKFIAKTGLRGFATWEAAGDYKDTLLDALRKGAGFRTRPF